MNVILRILNKINAFLYMMKKIKNYQINGFQHIVSGHFLQKQLNLEQQ